MQISHLLPRSHFQGWRPIPWHVPVLCAPFLPSRVRFLSFFLHYGQGGNAWESILQREASTPPYSYVIAPMSSPPTLHVTRLGCRRRCHHEVRSKNATNHHAYPGRLVVVRLRDQTSWWHTRMFVSHHRDACQKG